MWSICFYFEHYHRTVAVFSSQDDALFVFDYLQHAWSGLKDNMFLCKESSDSLKEIFTVVHHNVCNGECKSNEN